MSAETLSPAVYVLYHPIRARIIRLLMRSGKRTLETSEITDVLSREFGIDRSLVCSHLGELEQHGLVDGDWGNLYKEGEKCYRVTDKVEQCLAESSEYFQRL